MARLTIHHGDNLPLLRGMAAGSVDLIYVDPPFNTGRRQTRVTLATRRDDAGDRRGFQGRLYQSEELGRIGYDDRFDDYLGFLGPRLVEAHRLLAPRGSLFVHLDPREVHYVKVFLDRVFGRACFQNEIIWAYDYGGRSKSRWPRKHDNILWYSRHATRYTFERDACARIPYMAPGLVGAAKAARGKFPTDTWWHTIVSPNGREKTGYPNQKPRGIIDRIVNVHSRPGDLLLDFFAGSGTFGAAALALGRDCILIDDCADALRVMEKRFADEPVDWRGWTPGGAAGERGARES